jgi:hypothetical protein
MIGKHKKARSDSTSKILNYVLGKAGAEVLSTNLPTVLDPETLTQMMEATWASNRRIQKPIYHASLSLAPGEHLGDDTWRDIAQQYLAGMGFKNVPYLVVRHTDADHDHVHIVAGRNNQLTNRCIDDSWDHLRSRKLIKQIESQYTLTETAAAWKNDRAFLESGEARAQKYRGQTPTRTQLQTLVNELSQGGTNLETLVDQLESKGVEVSLQPTRSKTLGISYHFNDRHFSGSQLGSAYTLRGLAQRQGVMMPGSETEISQWWEDRKARAKDEQQVPPKSETKAVKPESNSRPRYYRSRPQSQEQLEL